MAITNNHGYMEISARETAGIITWVWVRMNQTATKGMVLRGHATSPLGAGAQINVPHCHSTYLGMRHVATLCVHESYYTDRACYLHAYVVYEQMCIWIRTIMGHVQGCVLGRRVIHHRFKASWATVGRFPDWSIHHIILSCEVVVSPMVWVISVYVFFSVGMVVDGRISIYGD